MLNNCNLNNITVINESSTCVFFRHNTLKARHFLLLDENISATAVPEIYTGSFRVIGLRSARYSDYMLNQQSTNFSFTWSILKLQFFCTLRNKILTSYDSVILEIHFVVFHGHFAINTSYNSQIFDGSVYSITDKHNAF